MWGNGFFVSPVTSSRSYGNLVDKYPFHTAVEGRCPRQDSHAFRLSHPTCRDNTGVRGALLWMTRYLHGNLTCSYKKHFTLKGKEGSRAIFSFIPHQKSSCLLWPLVPSHIIPFPLRISRVAFQFPTYMKTQEYSSELDPFGNTKEWFYVL
jgi:hypothetical protein